MTPAKTIETKNPTINSERLKEVKNSQITRRTTKVETNFFTTIPPLYIVCEKKLIPDKLKILFEYIIPVSGIMSKSRKHLLIEYIRS
jgi:hypothetical protein